MGNNLTLPAIFAIAALLFSVIALWIVLVKRKKQQSGSQNNLDKGEKPKKVGFVVNLLCSMMIVYIARGIYNMSTLNQDANVGLALTVFIVICLVWIYIIYKINDGRNWARITLLILTILSIPSFVLTVAASVSQDPFMIAYAKSVQPSSVRMVLSALELLLQITAILILFGRSSSKWFNGVRDDKKK